MVLPYHHLGILPLNDVCTVRNECFQNYEVCALTDNVFKCVYITCNSKQVRVDLQSSRELLRSAVNRAPMVALACRSSSSAVLQGPDLPTDLFKQSPEIDENLSNFGNIL